MSGGFRQQGIVGVRQADRDLAVPIDAGSIDYLFLCIVFVTLDLLLIARRIGNARSSRTGNAFSS